MLHSCVYTCSHKYTHVELHNSHMTLKIGYFSWKIVIFLVFLTQFSIFTIAEAVWTAECADKGLFFVQQNEADKKNWKICFWGVENLKLWPIFDWIRWKYTILTHTFWKVVYSCGTHVHTCQFSVYKYTTHTQHKLKSVCCCVLY